MQGGVSSCSKRGTYEASKSLTSPTFGVSSCSKRGTYEAIVGLFKPKLAVSSCSKRGTYEAYGACRVPGIPGK